jgi:DNA-binding MarR family transcriptional regulator
VPDDLDRRPGSTETSRKKDHQRSDLKDKLLLQQENSPVPVTEDHVLSVLSGRRGREAAIGRELFSDPAWDILLELYAAHLGYRRMILRELARSIDIPESTTARWISVLTDRGFLTTTDERQETVGASLELSPRGLAVMERLLAYWGSAFQSI